MAWALAKAVGAAASTDWAVAVATEVTGLVLALETLDLASATQCTMEDTDSPDSIEIYSGKPICEAKRR